MKNDSNDNLNLLLNLLGKDKKAPQTTNKEELNKYVMDSLNSQQTDMLKKLMNDPKAANDFINSTQAQEILKKLSKDKNK